MRDDPHQHPLVNKDEVRLIEEGSLARTKEIPKVVGEELFHRNYRFWFLTLIWGFTNIFYWGWATWMPTYFQVARNFSFKSAGYLYSVTFLFAIMAILLVSYFSDRLIRRAPFAAGGYIGGSLLFLVGGIVLANAYWALVVLVIALCFEQPGFAMCQTLLQSVVPERVMGSAVGVAGGVSQLMGAMSPALVGWIVGSIWFEGVVLFLGLACVIPGIIALFLAKEGY